MGRSRGGLTTKIHALVDAEGLPIGVMFTVAGQDDIRAIYPNISFKYFFEQN